MDQVSVPSIRKYLHGRAGVDGEKPKPDYQPLKVIKDGIDELREMLKDARRSEDAWNGFLEDFVDDHDIIARVKCRGPQ